jgi:hypothetical protein
VARFSAPFVNILSTFWLLFNLACGIKKYNYIFVTIILNKNMLAKNGSFSILTCQHWTKPLLFVNKNHRHKFIIILLVLKASQSQPEKKYGFFETFLENPKMDILKMSKIGFSFHFVLFFWDQKKYIKNVKYFVTIYDAINNLYISARE